ncbi:MAG: DUF3429 family protein [Sphingomonadales bacterium]|nr:MAG: DUF3429 family protein [Sphingomonadales bacterium]
MTPRDARLLGFAGLLPSLIAVMALLFAPPDLRPLGFRLGLLYGALILVFVSGTWWAFASLSVDARLRTKLLVQSVLPTFVALACLFSFSGVAALIVGLTFPLGLRVDRTLVQANLAPGWWLRLRVPLALGMGLLNALLGLVAWNAGL